MEKREIEEALFDSKENEKQVEIEM